METSLLLCRLDSRPRLIPKPCSRSGAARASIMYPPLCSRWTSRRLFPPVQGMLAIADYFTEPLGCDVTAHSHAVRCLSTRACHCCLGEISNEDDDDDHSTTVTIDQECGCVEKIQLKHGPDYYIFTFVYILIYTFIFKDQKNAYMTACLACHHRKARKQASHLRITTQNPLQRVINTMKSNK